MFNRFEMNFTHTSYHTEYIYAECCYDLSVRDAPKQCGTVQNTVSVSAIIVIEYTAYFLTSFYVAIANNDFFFDYYALILLTRLFINYLCKKKETYFRLHSFWGV